MSKKFKLVCDSPMSEGRVWTLQYVDDVVFGPDHLQFLSGDRVLVSVPHDRVQYFEELL